jgi:hypothetical protein
MLDFKPVLAAALALSISFPTADAENPRSSPVQATTVRTVAEFSHGAFLENLAIADDDAILITSYTDRTIKRIEFLQSSSEPNDGSFRPATPTVFAALDVHPVGIARLGDGYIVSAHAKSFLDGHEFSRTNLVLTLDSLGRERSRTFAHDARFLNGVAVSSTGDVLIADSITGSIWRFDPLRHSLSVWQKDMRLAPHAGDQPFRPGANGLKFFGRHLYVSNSSHGALYRVGLSGDSPKGTFHLHAKTGQIDDFAFDDDGTIVAATHGASLVGITPEGRVSTLMAEGCDGCTSVGFFGAGQYRRLIVLTTGNLLEQGQAPARVLSIDFPSKNRGGRLVIPHRPHRRKLR